MKNTTSGHSSLFLEVNNFEACLGVSLRTVHIGINEYLVENDIRILSVDVSSDLDHMEICRQIVDNLFFTA